MTSQQPAEQRHARYLYRYGIVVADDLVRKSMEAGKLPLGGAYVVRMKKPIPCMFFTFGHGGIMLPASGLNIIGDGWNVNSKEEMFAVGWLMNSLDPRCEYGIRASWVLIDLVESEGAIIKHPTDEEIASIRSGASGMKANDRELSRRIGRIRRRHTTAGADLPDGHEDDSDMSPDMAILLALEKREEKTLKAKRGHPPVPSTPSGRRFHRMMEDHRKATKQIESRHAEAARADMVRELFGDGASRRAPGEASATAPARGPSAPRPAARAPTAPQAAPPRPSRPQRPPEPAGLHSEDSASEGLPSDEEQPDSEADDFGNDE
jgi:hypothetical protein